MFTFLFITLVNCQQIKIYIESLCPDTIKQMKAISDATIENIELLGEVEFIPAGKISSLEGHISNTYFSECQHREIECYGNMIIACGLQITKSQQESVKFIKCFYSNLQDTSNDRELKFKNSVDKCFDTQQKKLLVNACSHSPQGIELLYKHIKQTPKLGYVPSIQINGEIEMLKEDFGRKICKQDNAPNQCQNIKWL